MKPVLPALVCLMALMAGCASPPTRHYSLLTPSPAGMPADPSPGQAAYGLRLDVLQVPPEADRPQLVVRDPAQDPAVQVLNESVWAAPLAEQVRSVLASAVAARLGVPDLEHLPGTQDRPARRIDVRLTRFDLIWGEAVDLAGQWTDQAPGLNRARLCQGQVRLPVGPGVAALVEGQRQALQRLADLIAGHEGTSPAAGFMGSSASSCT
jgi:uncharacterized lipoprotein YmbA